VPHSLEGEDGEKDSGKEWQRTLGVSVSDKFLFIFGTARSGTSALCKLLNKDPRICLGLERYSAISRTSQFTPALFEENRFFDMQPGDTWYPSLDKFAEHYAALRHRYGNAEFRGDKIPPLVRRLDYLLQTFPTARLLITVRDIFDVAASYEARADEGLDWPESRRTMNAIQDWNLMLENSLRHVHESRIHWVIYEDFFSDPMKFDELYAFLGMTPPPAARAALALMLGEQRKRRARRMNRLGEAERALINQHARVDLLDRLHAHVRKRAGKKSPTLLSGLCNLLPAWCT